MEDRQIVFSRFKLVSVPFFLIVFMYAIVWVVHEASHTYKSIERSLFIWTIY